MKKNHYIIAIVLISVFFLAQSIWSMREKSATFDEIGHVAAGYSFLKYNDYRLYDVDPPLMRQIAAFPLLFMKLNFPIHSEGWKEKKEIDVGYDFFYKINGRKADKILFLARLPVVFISLLLGLLLLKFATDLWNIQTGLFAFFLFSFEPNFLAHARLATTDMGLALFLTLSVYFTYRYWKSPSLKSAALMGVSFGLAIASKTPGMILIPFFFVVLLIVRPAAKGADSSLPLLKRLKAAYWNKKEGTYFLHWVVI
ncbi:MAG: phospholipid carrier-dependent glycosyltransferase, partial [Calditrichaeota bacterium]|nr:phospholipid carrier-dependent glycosyltransferase [Calditrichota bacterium]